MHGPLRCRGFWINNPTNEKPNERNNYMSTYQQIDPKTVLFRTIKKCDSWTQGLQREKIVGCRMLNAIRQVCGRSKRELTDHITVESYQYNPDRLIVRGPHGFFECDLEPINEVQ